MRTLTEKGFTLAETLVVVAILGIVALAGASLSQFSNKATQYADRKLQLSAVTNLVMENLKNSSSCQAALASASLTNSIGGPPGTGKGKALGFYKKHVMGSGYQNGQPIKAIIPNLGAGPTGTGTTIDASLPAASRTLPARKLVLNDLRIADGIDLGPSGANFEYIANVYLVAQDIDGFAYQPVLVGAIDLFTDVSGNIKACNSINDTTNQAVCQDMGCTYVQGQVPACRCIRSQVLCAAPGYVPVAFKNGVPDCRQIGGSCTGANEFLVGIGIQNVTCAPVATTCPTGSSTTGVGPQVPGLAACSCVNATDLWDPPTKTCVAPPVACVGSWSACSVTCGGGTKTYTITTPASGGGAACPYANGASRGCNTTACATSPTPAASPTSTPSASPTSPIDGLCGAADTGTFADSTAANAAGPLCTTGSSSVASLSGSGPWSWSCTGSGGGTTDLCSAIQGSGPLCNGQPRPPTPSCGLMPYGGHKCEPSLWTCDTTGWSYECWTYVKSPAVCP